MKHILCFIMLFPLSLALFGVTPAKVIDVKKEEKVLIIDKGSEKGVEEGMKGKALMFLEDSITGKMEPIPVGKFIVRKVYKNSSELYLEEIAGGAEPGMAEQVEFDEEFLTPGERIIDYINNLDQSSKLTKDDKERLKLILKEGLDLLEAGKVSTKDYIDYKSKKPGEVILNALWEKLIADGSDPNLPPEKYLDAGLPLAKNDKGYYEITFPGKNNHVMIYIPGKKFFIDKYEVSNAQYLQFATPLKKIKFSDPKLVNYPQGCPAYPAVVSYQEAETYCNKFGLRLPNESEWEEIAGFNKGYNYSWGDDEADKSGIYRANFESMEDGYLEAAPVDSFTTYASPYGAVNMSGNVSEWVNEKFSKGGSLLSEPGELNITTGKYTSPIYVGFRCIMEAEQ